MSTGSSPRLDSPAFRLVAVLEQMITTRGYHYNSLDAWSGLLASEVPASRSKERRRLASSRLEGLFQQVFVLAGHLEADQGILDGTWEHLIAELKGLFDPGALHYHRRYSPALFDSTKLAFLRHLAHQTPTDTKDVVTRDDVDAVSARAVEWGDEVRSDDSLSPWAKTFLLGQLTTLDRSACEFPYLGPAGISSVIDHSASEWARAVRSPEVISLQEKYLERVAGLWGSWTKAIGWTGVGILAGLVLDAPSAIVDSIILLQSGNPPVEVIDAEWDYVDPDEVVSSDYSVTTEFIPEISRQKPGQDDTGEGNG